MAILAVERRQGTDRRLRPTSPLTRLFRPGQRRSVRRVQEQGNAYVDVFEESWLLAVAISTVILSILDGYLTLIHLQNGGRELNPFVDILIGWGWTPFIAIKSALSALCVGFLVMHKNFYMVKKLLIAVFIIYSLLLVYHLYLRTLN